MGKVFYRKYRSKSLDEILGQDHITRTLKNAIKNNRISHAYLLTGPRGVGKTSVARILAHEINKIPYDENVTNIDIIEIDAASNRRIDEIRELRDKIHITPALLTYKVYIIDEVHMLTKEAFNALLKTLEEPPEHAIFVLATTEAHKLPETIISRTQRYNFKPLNPSIISNHLKTIAKSEKINIDSAALDFIAEHGDGSFRDSISLLDQVSNIYGDIITKDNVIELLGIAPNNIIAEIIELIEKGQPKDVAPLQTKISDLGLSVAQITKQLSQYIRTNLINNIVAIGSYDSTDLLHNMLDIQASTDPTEAFEIFLYEHTTLKNSIIPKLNLNNHEELKKQDNKPKKTATQIEETVVPLETSARTAKQPPSSNDSIQNLINEGLMQKVLKELKKTHNTLYAVARLAQPASENDQLILECNFAFHSKQLNDSKNIKIIQNIIKDITGHNIAIKSVAKTGLASKDTKNNVGSDTLSTISTIFGGGELLED